MKTRSTHIIVVRLLSLLVCAVAALALGGGASLVGQSAGGFVQHDKVSVSVDRGTVSHGGHGSADKIDCDRPMAVLCASETSPVVFGSRPQTPTSLLNTCLKINRNGVLQGFGSVLFRSTLSGMSSLKPHFCAKSTCFAIVLRHIIR